MSPGGSDCLPGVPCGRPAGAGGSHCRLDRSRLCPPGKPPSLRHSPPLTESKKRNKTQSENETKDAER